MPRTFLADAAPGDYLEDVFVLSNKQLSTTQTGKPFIKCMIGDRSKQVSGRMWNASQSIFNAMPDGGFLRVAGKVESYQDNIQFIIDRFWLVDDESELDVADLLPTTKKNIGQMFDEVKGIVASIRHPALKRLMDDYLNDAELMTRFRKSPAATSFHHAFVGGLLEHTLNMLKVGVALVPLYPGISRDLIIAGIFLHDIAKTWELSSDVAFGYTDGGHLVGHIVKSAMWVESRAARLNANGAEIPHDLVNVLQHLILSHHGTPEWGAARVPATPEAILIHYIDNIDAKLTMSLGVTRESADGGAFTDYQKALGVRLYRPDVARVEEEAGSVGMPPPALDVPAKPAAKPTPSAAKVEPVAKAEPKVELMNPLFATSERGLRPG